MADKVPYQTWYNNQPIQKVAFDFWAQPVLKDSNGLYFCPGFEGNTYLANPWDFIAFGTQNEVQDPYTAGPSSFSSKTPGKCNVTFTKFRDVDKKKQSGSDGARLTLHGVEPAEVDIEVLIWTPEQWRQMKTLWSVINPGATKGTPPAYDAYHPALAMQDVKALVFVSGTGPDIDDKRVGHFKMKAWEYLPPSKKAAVKTVIQKKGNLLDPSQQKQPASNTSQPASYPKPSSSGAAAKP
jgi:hypothetical protein